MKKSKMKIRKPLGRSRETGSPEGATSSTSRMLTPSELESLRQDSIEACKEADRLLADVKPLKIEN